MKEKSESRSKLIKKLDKVFSLYIRLRDTKDGYLTCPLCGKKIYRKDAQNMHFITRSCMRYRRDEDNCHAGCMRCNVFLNGNYIIYTRRMQRKYGIEKIDEMITKKNDVFKIHTSEIKEKIEYYKTKINELQPSL